MYFIQSILPIFFPVIFSTSPLLLFSCYFFSCYFFSYFPTVTFFPVTFFPVTFFPVTFFPLLFFLLPFFLLLFFLLPFFRYFFSCYFLSYNHKYGVFVFVFVFDQISNHVFVFVFDPPYLVYLTNTFSNTLFSGPFLNTSLWNTNLHEYSLKTCQRVLFFFKINAEV